MRTMAATLPSQAWLPPFMAYIQLKNQGNWIQVARLNRRPLMAEVGSRRRPGIR